jgi:hypothetical protein
MAQNLAELGLLLLVQLHRLLLFWGQGAMCTHGREQFESGLRREQTATAMQRVQIK